MSAERLLTYDEAAAAFGKSHEAVRQLAKRRRWRRALGNDGRARIAIPVEELGGARTPDVPPASARPPPGRPPVDQPNASAEPTGDARALLDYLQARVA